MLLPRIRLFVYLFFLIVVNNGLSFSCLFSEGDEEFPTLLHFAVRFGFERLTWALLDCPGSVAALNVRNNHNLSVMQLAEAHGQTVILNYLRSYLAVMV